MGRRVEPFYIFSFYNVHLGELSIFIFFSFYNVWAGGLSIFICFLLYCRSRWDKHFYIFSFYNVWPGDLSIFICFPFILYGQESWASYTYILTECLYVCLCVPPSNRQRTKNFQYICLDISCSYDFNKIVSVNVHKFFCYI